MLLPGGATVGEVYPELISVGAELEKMHPNLFNRVARQIGCGSFSSEQSASGAIVDVSREMIRNGEMTWSKVIAIYAIAGGIAVDCVRQGKTEYLLAIQRGASKSGSKTQAFATAEMIRNAFLLGMKDVLEDDLATWIQANGGWVRQSRLCNINILLMHVDYIELHIF